MAFQRRDRFLTHDHPREERSDSRTTFPDRRRRDYKCSSPCPQEGQGDPETEEPFREDVGCTVPVMR